METKAMVKASPPGQRLPWLHSGRHPELWTLTGTYSHVDNSPCCGQQSTGRVYECRCWPQYLAYSRGILYTQNRIAQFQLIASPPPSFSLLPFALSPPLLFFLLLHNCPPKGFLSCDFPPYIFQKSPYCTLPICVAKTAGDPMALQSLF